MFRHFLAAFFLTLNAATVFGQQYLDQENPDINLRQHGGLIVRSNAYIGQVVTAGLGGRLSRLELSLSRDQETTHPLIIDVAPTIGDAPVFDEASRLARLIVQPSQVPLHQFPPPVLNVGFTLPGPVLAAGERFAVVLRTESGNISAYVWQINDVNSYGAGGVYASNDGNVTAYSGDAHFRTYMTVPEAPTSALAMIGILGAMTRRSNASGGSSRNR